MGRVHDWSSSYLVGVRSDWRWMAFSWITGKSFRISIDFFFFLLLFLPHSSSGRYLATFHLKLRLSSIFILFYHLSQSRGIISPACRFLKWPSTFDCAALPKVFSDFLFRHAFFYSCCSWAVLASGDILKNKSSEETSRVSTAHANTWNEQDCVLKLYCVQATYNFFFFLNLNRHYGFNVEGIEFNTKLLFNSYAIAFAWPKVSRRFSMNWKVTSVE